MVLANRASSNCADDYYNNHLDGARLTSVRLSNLVCFDVVTGASLIPLGRFWVRLLLHRPYAPSAKVWFEQAIYVVRARNLPTGTQASIYLV